MRCNDFDAQIDEMLSGILHPDASQHMRQCERCMSHYRARTAVQSGLRKLALASEQGPSAATDRAVMDAYRNLQLGRLAAGQSQAAPQASARVLTFPGRGSASPRVSPDQASPHASPRSSNHWWGGAAAAALVLAVLGSGLHVRNGITTVSAPTAANVTEPSATQSVAASAASAPVSHEAVIASVVSPRVSPRTGQPPATRYATQSGLQPNARQSNVIQVDAASSEVASGSEPSAPSVVAAKATREASSQANASPLIHLASSEAANSAGAASGGANESANNAARPPNSTWPGYSNLVYCDPVVCSGPMEVVHIKVPAGQGKPDSGEGAGNGFVGADVVVGPDGVARAIRVAN